MITKSVWKWNTQRLHDILTPPLIHRLGRTGSLGSSHIYLIWSSSLRRETTYQLTSDSRRIEFWSEKAIWRQGAACQLRKPAFNVGSQLMCSVWKRWKQEYAISSRFTLYRGETRRKRICTKLSRYLRLPGGSSVLPYSILLPPQSWDTTQLATNPNKPIFATFQPWINSYRNKTYV